MSCRFVRHMFPAVACLAALAVTLHAAGPDKKSKPSIVVKVSPLIGFSPARMVLTADLKGGSDDYEEFYCPTVEWDWGDGTRSESTVDCDPYEPGKSEIRRRYSMQHLYTLSGLYRIQVRLKRKERALTAANISIQVRPGFRENPFQNP